jgi:superfamily II DNA or RNA helicase
MPVTALLKDRLYLPATESVQARADAHFNIRLYKEAACKTCSFKAWRHSEQCDTCPNYEGELQLWKKAMVNGKPKIGVPIGDRKALKAVVGGLKLKIVDKRTRTPLGIPLQMTRKLYPYQVKACREMVARGHGILKSPPRSGKTMMSVAMAVKLKMRVLILAAQEDYLEQFMTEFEQSTNIREIEEFEGRPLMAITTKPEKMEGLPIVLATYQSFSTQHDPKGKKLAQIKDKFGLVITDEIHMGAAPEFSRVLVAFSARYRFGLSGTPRRKDGREKFLFKIVGNVAAETQVEAMIPTVMLVETQAKPKHAYKNWVFACRFLFTHEHRNKMIVAYAVHDIKKGRSVMIPTGTVKHAKLLVDEINKKFDQQVAIEFTSKAFKNKTHRKELLESMKTGQMKCVVGSRQLLQTGLNIPILSVLYVVAPQSNEPRMEQETARVRTKMEGKPDPLIRHFIDPGLKQAITSFRTCYMQTYVPKGFKMDAATRKKAKEYMATAGNAAGQKAILFNNGGIV